MSVIIIPRRHLNEPQNPVLRRDNTPASLLVVGGKGWDLSGLASDIDPRACTRVPTAYGMALATPRNPTGDPGFSFSPKARSWEAGKTVAVAVVCVSGSIARPSALFSSADATFFSLSIDQDRSIGAYLWNGYRGGFGYALPSDGAKRTLFMTIGESATTLYVDGDQVGVISTASQGWGYFGNAVGHRPGTYDEIDPIKVLWAGAWNRFLAPNEMRSIAANHWDYFFRADPLRIYSLPSGPIGISWSSLTASNITQTGATLTLGGITR